MEAGLVAGRLPEPAALAPENSHSNVRNWLVLGVMSAVLALIAGTLILRAGQRTKVETASSSSSTVGTSTPAPTTTTSVTTATATTLPPAPVVTGASPPPAAAPGAPTASGAGSYQTKTNPRYGFSCDIPAGYRLISPPAANGDGFAYEQTRGFATVVCSGSNNSGTTSPKAEFDKQVADRRDSSGTVTYSALIGNAITLSGIQGGNIFYDKILWGPGSINAMRWEYSQALADSVEDSIVHTAKAFKSGDLSVAH